MKLVSVTINNYRSILKAYKLTISSFTVLVGPNNEGKSNILKAINLGLDILANWSERKPVRFRPLRYRSFQQYTERIDFNWIRDFPLSLQDEQPDGKSVVTLELELTPADLTEFQRATAVNLNTNLKVKVGFGAQDVSYDILMKGRGKKSLNSKREEISSFIQERIVYQYISAIRPATYTRKIIERVLDNELSKLENNKQYQQALGKIEQIQKPVLDNLSARILDTMRKFIPSVSAIDIRRQQDYRRYIKRECKVFIDDGTNTELDMKGDGIISLSALSLVRHFSSELSSAKNLIFAIEEPESHLHPNGITQLKVVLASIAIESQVIITTHSPILVDRNSIENNIVVDAGMAQRAKSIAQIREALGIRLSDNLVNAQLILLVEGQSDKIIVGSLLTKASAKVRGAMERGVIAVDSTGGAAKLPYCCQFYKQSLSNVHVYFDNDEEGQRQINFALRKSIIQENEYTLVNCQGMGQSEIEDMFRVETYNAMLLKKYGVNLQVAAFRNSDKWSVRAKAVFQQNGKLWDERIEENVKNDVARAIASTGLASLNEHKRTSFDALVSILERRIDQYK